MTDAVRKPKQGFGPWLRENIECLAVAVIFALWIRHYGLEIFKIPTGSMATTLLGSHKKADCPRCGWPILAGHRSHGHSSAPVPQDFVTCPNCGLEEIDLRTVRSRGGHKIIANKFLYRWVRAPKRWEVVVFRFYDDPYDRERNYIKRLAGLPGDTLFIEGGDLYLQQADGSEQILRKPYAVQEGLWVPLTDSRHEKDGWAAWEGDSSWRLENDSWAHQGEPSHLHLTRPPHSSLVYNPADETHPVGDVRVRTECVIPADGWLEFKISHHAGEKETGPFEYGCRLAPGGGSFWWKEEEGRRSESPIPSSLLKAGEQIKAAWSQYDGACWLEIDGKLLLREAPARAGLNQKTGIEIRAQGEVVLSRIRTDRDLYYTDNRSPDRLASRENPVRLGAGQHFFLGDNSTNSYDGRRWPRIRGPDREQGPYITRGKIVGKAFCAIRYLDLDWPWRIPWKEIRFERIR
jgi:signal peptidase I